MTATNDPIHRIPTVGPTPATALRPVLVMSAIVLATLAAVLAMWWYFSSVSTAASPEAGQPGIEAEK